MELVIVIIIIGVVTAATVPAFFRGMRDIKFTKTVNEIATLFEVARTQALASELNNEGKIPPGGYGVFLAKKEEQSAILFIDDWNEDENDEVKMDYANPAIIFVIN